MISLSKTEVLNSSKTDRDPISLTLCFSGLLSAGGMGLWHGVEHYEKMKITEKSDVELFVKAWPKLLVKTYKQIMRGQA